MKNALIQLSICLSDIPKDKIKLSEKNGKKYLSLTVRPRKEPDQFGNDIYAILALTKEEQDEEKEIIKSGGEPYQKIYLGQGRFFQFEDRDNAQNMNYIDPNVPDDLPF